METLNLGIDGIDDIVQIGAGGSSRVYRATQVELDRTVALKVLKAADDPEISRRFDRERKAMGRLSLHDGIVPVYSTGLTDRGEPYLIMPYYENGSLQDRIDLGPVPWAEAVGYVADAADTMTAAHDAGIVHLDLKPANILLTGTGQPRIADFGIARLMSEQAGTTSSSGPSFTPTFSAPETLMGGDASPASDVYGLAATLWALIAGGPPFRSPNPDDNTLMAVVGRVVHQPPGNLRDVAPDAICSVIETAMAKDPTDRYPTAGDFRRALASASSAAATPAAGSSDHVPGQLMDADLLSTAPVGSAGMHETASPSSLRFEAPVPPRLVPAAPNRSAGLADAVDRYSGIVVGLMVAALLVAGIVLFQRILSSTEPTSGDGTVLAGPTTSTTESPATSTDSASTTVATTTTSTSLATSAAPAPATSATTPTTVATSATSETTTPTSDTTDPSTSSSDTTDPSTSSTDTTDSSTSSTDPDTSTSETSETTTSTTDPEPTPLPAPTSLAADLRPTNVLITWNAPTPLDGVAGYTVTRNGVALAQIGNPGNTRFRDNSIEPGETYVYRVIAIAEPDSGSTNSAPSGGLTVIVPPEDPPVDDPDDGEPER